MTNHSETTAPAPRRRFVPVPIETSYQQYRKGPTGELTPEASPRSASTTGLSQPTPEAPRTKRRFAPQLVESSVRRSRRAGDNHPATRPTDRTDITPYTNHIYAPRSKRNYGASDTGSDSRIVDANTNDGHSLKSPRFPGHGRRESCDDVIASDAFGLVAKDAQTKYEEELQQILRRKMQEEIQELAMSAFPNSSQRAGGAVHYYVHEGSGSDDDHLVRAKQETKRSRRDSTEEDVSWAVKEMQQHAHTLQQARDQVMEDVRAMTRERISTLELDAMSFEGPPSDAMRLTSRARLSWQRSMDLDSPVLGPFHLRPESPMPTIGESVSAVEGKAADSAPSKIILDAGARNQPSPFRRFPPADKGMSPAQVRNLNRLKALHSPPMAGKDLVFRMCPSPKMTKLEPDHLWDLETGATAIDENNHDATGHNGLWRGYCYTANTSKKLESHAPMIMTPLPPATPMVDYFDIAAINTEPMSVTNMTHTGTMSAADAEHHALTSAHRALEAKGLHMLQGLEERLAREKAAKDRDEHIATEFNDTFVTQVYNYLSLGYPATARQYDNELSKISRIAMADLERDDEVIMDHLWAHGADDKGPRSVSMPSGKRLRVMGHIMLDSEEKEGVREEDRCERWKALKLYIHEWARQHPDLNAISPLAWGMQERRGSWGI